MFSNFLLEAFDKFFSLVILPPFVISYWRGTYNLLNIFVYANDIELRSWLFLIVGILGNFILTYYQRQIKLFLNPETNRIRFLIGSRIYTIISSIICVNGFRSTWHLFDIYFTSNIKQIMVFNMLVVLIVLGTFKGIRNILDTPYFLVNDCYEKYFYIPTRYQMSVKYILTKQLFNLPSVNSKLYIFFKKYRNRENQFYGSSTA